MVTSPLDQALQLVRRATGGRGLDRAAVLEWHQLLQKASGEEAEQIGFMAEALVTSAQNQEDRAWLQGLLAGGSEQANRDLELAKQMARSMNARGDAKDEPAAADDGIDWAKVAREAQTMVDLNRPATEAWQSSRKGTKGEEG